MALALPPIPDPVRAELEAEFRRVALRLFGDERRILAALIERAVEAGGDATLKRALVWFANQTQSGGALFGRWLVAYEALTRSAFVAAGQHVRAATGISFNLSNPRVQTAIQDRAATLATHVGDTTARLITAAVSEGRSAGEGVRQIAARIQDASQGDAMTARRAFVIAQVESLGSLATGEFLSVSESGVFRSKQWNHSGLGKEPRPAHVALDGKRIPIGEMFTAGLEVPMRFPHDPNAPLSENALCRCVATFYDEAA